MPTTDTCNQPDRACPQLDIHDNTCNQPDLARRIEAYPQTQWPQAAGLLGVAQAEHARKLLLLRLVIISDPFHDNEMHTYSVQTLQAHSGSACGVAGARPPRTLLPAIPRDSFLRNTISLWTILPRPAEALLLRSLILGSAE